MSANYTVGVRTSSCEWGCGNTLMEAMKNANVSFRTGRIECVVAESVQGNAMSGLECTSPYYNLGAFQLGDLVPPDEVLSWAIQIAEDRKDYKLAQRLQDVVDKMWEEAEEAAAV